MLPRILSVIAALVLAISALDLFIFRGRKRGESTARSWEIAPIIGFLGAVLLALAFVEAARREVIDAWSWGIAFGLVMSVCAAVAMIYRTNRRAERNASSLRRWLQIAQTYGLLLLLGILGVMIAVRIIGALLEVFIASALGTLVVAIAVAVFAASWRRGSVKSNQ